MDKTIPFRKSVLKAVFGRVISSFSFYQSVYYHPAYAFQGYRLSNEELHLKDEYVNKWIRGYREEQLSSADIEKLSQYYLFKKIEQTGLNNLKICNIGCFYCSSEKRFLEKNSSHTVYGLDFGDIITLYKENSSPNLLLFPGYPLATLENFAREREREREF